MTLIPAAQYIAQRAAYDYCDPDVEFTIIQTGGLPYVGRFRGIFPRIPTSPDGINLRRFETICQSVFKDCSDADIGRRSTEDHHGNLRQVVEAIVHWKMASQGGRGRVEGVRKKWEENTHHKLLRAYRERYLWQFCIGGVGIPTATTFLRFLYPDEFGIMDSRVVNEHTQCNRITTLRLQGDRYIRGTRENTEKYRSEYMPFLKHEADALNKAEANFNDADDAGRPIVARFRPCDVEMALFWNNEMYRRPHTACRQSPAPRR